MDRKGGMSEEWTRVSSTKQGAKEGRNIRDIIMYIGRLLRKAHLSRVGSGRFCDKKITYMQRIIPEVR